MDDLLQERYGLTEALGRRARRDHHRIFAGFVFVGAIAWYLLGW